MTADTPTGLESSGVPGAAIDHSTERKMSDDGAGVPVGVFEVLESSASSSSSESGR